MMLTGNEASTLSEWRLHWKVLPPCVAGVMMAGIHLFSLGVMIGPLEREFGWTRAEISTGPMIVSILALLVAPLAGLAVDRFGARRIGLFGMVFFCAMLGRLSTATPNIHSWWASWATLGLAFMFVFPPIWLVAINGYFIKNRGLALAICLCGSGLGAALIPPLTQYLVQTRGWRGAYIGLALMSLAIAFPLIWFLFHTVTDQRRVKPANGQSRAHGASLPGVSVREGIRSSRFFKLAAAVVIFSLACSALTTNSVPVLIAQGFGPAKAAALAGLIGIGSITGRLAGGYLLDRLHANKVAAVSVLAPVISVALLLAFAGSVIAAGAACVILGLSVGTELDASAYLAARHFGLRNFGALFGTINGMLLFVVGVAPLAANYAYDLTSSYHVVLWAIIPACVVAAVLFLFLGTYPQFGEESSTAAKSSVTPAAA